MLKAFAHTSGPRSAKMLLVGEAWGESEDKLKLPFVGYSGKEFFRLLGEVWPDVEPKLHAFICQCMSGDSLWSKQREPWLEAASIMLTNVFTERPPENKLDAWCGKKGEVGADYKLPPLAQGKYMRPEYLHHLERLAEEINTVGPNVIVALGASAAWAIMQAPGITAIRGTVAGSVAPPGHKVLPTYHPAAIMRQWAWRPILIADLMKARRESAFPDIRRPARQIIVDPSFEDIGAWLTRWRDASLLSVDIETLLGQITCIGFAASRGEALVIPFLDQRKPGWSYWSSSEDELLAWQCVEDILMLPAEKLFQNGLFDLQYILRMGIRPRNCRQDTMLLHHALYPEMKKGLGFLGSIYTNEASWKLMRGKTEEIKADE